MPKVHIQYFDILREQRGTTAESIDTSAASIGELYNELRALHKFSLPVDRIRAAVNDEFVAAMTWLRESVRIVFIPPVAGG